MIINHNIAAMDASRVLTDNGISSHNVTEKLSSGLRINRGADDAAGLAVSEKMRAQVRGLNMAYRNAQDGVSLLQTAEGYLQETTSALQRMRELSVQAANGIYDTKDRQYIQSEMQQLTEEVERIAQQSQFNKKDLFVGNVAPEQGAPAGATPPATPATPNSSTFPMPLHVGPNMDQRIYITINNMTAGALGLAETTQTEGSKDIAGQQVLKAKLDVKSADGANKAIGDLDKALDMVNDERTRLGAYQNRLDMAMKGVSVAAENLQASESRIRDTDMAKEMIDFVKLNILSQASTSMLAQANLRPQLVLRVLG